MNAHSTIRFPIVFLHIPKTAGQTVHNALQRAVGENAVSPIRVHTQAAAGEAQLPPNYSLYSGHIDWIDLETLPKPRFVFSILRDPKERLASFYLYLKREAQKLSADMLERPENTGKRAALTLSADDYFFGQDNAWRAFIEDHYDNFYCTYFATKMVRGRRSLDGLGKGRILKRAMANISDIDWIYSVDNLAPLEADLNTLFGFQLKLTRTFDNASRLERKASRWDILMNQLERDSSREKLEAFVTLDQKLMRRLEI